MSIIPLEKRRDHGPNLQTTGLSHRQGRGYKTCSEESCEQSQIQVRCPVIPNNVTNVTLRLMLCLCLQVFNKFAVHLMHVLLICGCGQMVIVVVDVVKWLWSSFPCGQVVVVKWLWWWTDDSCGCGGGQVVV